MKKEKEVKHKKGGIIDPKLAEKVLFELEDAEVERLARHIGNKLRMLGKVYIKNVGTLELKLSNRKQRYDVAKKEWLNIPATERVLVKLHKNFTNKILGK